MASHALRTPDDAARSHVLRFLDLAVLALALPVFVVTGLPLFAWAGTTAAWLLQRGVQALVVRRVHASDNPRVTVGLMSVSLMGRIWFLLLAALTIGLIDRDAGLPATVLLAVTFQAWFIGFMLDRGSRGPAPK